MVFLLASFVGSLAALSAFSFTGNAVGSWVLGVSVSLCVLVLRRGIDIIISSLDRLATRKPPAP